MWFFHVVTEKRSFIMLILAESVSKLIDFAIIFLIKDSVITDS